MSEYHANEQTISDALRWKRLMELTGAPGKPGGCNTVTFICDPSERIGVIYVSGAPKPLIGNTFEEALDSGRFYRDGR